MSMPDLIAEGRAAMGAAGLAAKLRSGEVSAAAVVGAHIERVDATLNAVVVRRLDEARAEALEADAVRAAGRPLGPLHGVPITFKEQYPLSGTATTFPHVAAGSPRRSRRSSRHSTPRGRSSSGRRTSARR